MGKSFVVITGASSGIGEVFARQLAAQDENLILIARREELLVALADELKEKHQIEVKTVCFDVTDEKALNDWLSSLEADDIPIKGLINNAGFGLRGQFAEQELARLKAMIDLNVMKLVTLTHRLLPRLKSQDDAFIINLASTAAFQAGPNMAIYYASKAFVLSFTEALHEELKGKVHVTALCPGPTRTEFAKIADMENSLHFKLGQMSAEDIVSTALGARRRAVVVPGLKDKIGTWLVKFAPKWIVRKVVMWMQT